MFRRAIKHKTISFYFFSGFSFSCLVSASSAKQNYQNLGCLYDNRGRGVSVGMPREFTVEMLEDDWGGPVPAAVVERLPQVFRWLKFISDQSRVQLSLTSSSQPRQGKRRQDFTTLGLSWKNWGGAWHAMITWSTRGKPPEALSRRSRSTTIRSIVKFSDRNKYWLTSTYCTL